MRNIWYVALSGFLAASAFFVLKSGETNGPQPLSEVSAAADRIAARWSKDGAAWESRMLTLVLADHYEGSEPLSLAVAAKPQNILSRWFSGRDSGAFVRAMEREPDTISWSMGALSPEEEDQYLEPFARILVKTGGRGGIRIIAHGYSADFAVKAVRRAAQSGRAPRVSRLLGVGISSKLLSARNPSVYEWAEQSGAIAEWINIWSDESEIAPDIYAERWRPGDAAPSVSSHPWKSYAWPAVVAGVAQGGAAGLPKSERIEVAAAARPGHTSSSDRKETRKSTIDMLLAKEEGGVRPVQGGDAAASAEFSEIGDTGWVMEKLKEFAYVNVGGEIASWAQGDALVRVSYKKGNTGRAQHAEEECKRKGYKSQQIAFRGALAKVCNQIPFSSVSSQRIDIFTIVSPEFFISVYYQYADDSARSTHLPMYTKAVEALRPKKK